MLPPGIAHRRTGHARVPAGGAAWTMTRGPGRAARRVVAIAPGCALLVACAAERAASPAERYRCVVTPNNLVECNLVQDAATPTPR